MPSVEQASVARSPLFRCAAIVGVGMMGGSLGLAIGARGVTQTVVGVDLDAANLARARHMGAIDEGVTELRAGVANADVVILAAPVSVIPTLLQSLVPLVRPDALITDIGSAKRHIVAVGEACFGTRFVGGHPMAGSPQGGIDAALPDLFQGAAWAVVRSQMPDEDNDPFVRQAAELARRLGARPVLLDSAAHDRTVALVSHLPHILSFAFADVVAGSAPTPPLQTAWPAAVSTTCCACPRPTALSGTTSLCRTAKRYQTRSISTRHGCINCGRRSLTRSSSFCPA